MQSEATPGEDEMNPTVKRSGWHPPEDTGLWAIADRVAAEVNLSVASSALFNTAWLYVPEVCNTVLCMLFRLASFNKCHITPKSELVFCFFLFSGHNQGPVVKELRRSVPSPV